MARVPFRIKVSLWLLAFLLAVPLLGPFLVPVPRLEGLSDPEGVAGPESLFVSVEGVQLHVQTWPAGTTPEDVAARGDAIAGHDDPAQGRLGVIMLHGFGSQTRTWRHLGAALADSQLTPSVTLAFDRPAFGLSERPERASWGRGRNPYGQEAQVAYTLGLMDAYGLDRALLVGHSAGGTLALEVALAAPERVAGLILVSPAVYAGGGAPAWSRPLLSTPQLERLGPLLMRSFAGRPGEDFLRAAYFDPDALDPLDEAAYRRALQVEGWDRALWELVKASRESDLESFVTRIEAPTLVLTGDTDAIVPRAQSERLARELPDASFRALPECGHVAHEECPEEVIVALQDWLSEAAARLLD